MQSPAVLLLYLKYFVVMFVLDAGACCRKRKEYESQRERERETGREGERESYKESIESFSDLIYSFPFTNMALDLLKLGTCLKMKLERPAIQHWRCSGVPCHSNQKCSATLLVRCVLPQSQQSDVFCHSHSNQMCFVILSQQSIRCVLQHSHSNQMCLVRLS